MGDYTIRTVGLSELRRELRRVEKTLPKRLGEANRQAADIIAREARRRAPKGPHQGGGRITPVEQSIKALSRANMAAVAFGGARSPHGPVYEFGGSIRRYHSGTRTSVHERPFLYPAITAKRQEVTETYLHLVSQALDPAFPD